MVELAQTHKTMTVVELKDRKELRMDKRFD